VVEGPDGLLLVDQHALHERWNYEQLARREGAGGTGEAEGAGGGVASQALLIPAVVELAPAEAAGLEEALPLLRELGFRAERFGLATLSVSAAPTVVPPGAVARVVREVVADLAEPGRAVADLRERARASLACRTAVLFNRELPRAELEALLDRFHRAAQPLTCPHGRPTTVTLTWDELARRFGRR
jgi:DNA mismatch repair protein MutL